jgi:hypothetical protein
VALTPQAFIAKWLNSPIKERAAAQAHFHDLCDMLGVPKPADLDPTGKDYGFEVGATKTTGGQGFADVFRRGFFAWEYKGTGADLGAAFAQLQRYAVALDNPPLLIVSDVGTTIRIHTNWTNSVSKRYDIPVAELGDPEKLGWIKAALTDPEALKPSQTRQQLTEEVASEFSILAHSLRRRGHDPLDVAHFINRLVFCMFAEDVKLLPNAMFTRMLEGALENPDEFETFARDLFAAMTTGGRVGFEKVKRFNGGLFDGDLVFALTKDEIAVVHRAAKYDWAEVDPSILGTLFERGLDPGKRGQLGAHYTDRDKIMMIVKPVIVEPLAAEWEATKAEIGAHYGRAEAARRLAPGDQRDARKTYAIARRQEESAQRAAVGAFGRYMQRLRDFRVLDPACGSGNFLYLALAALKDVEHRASIEMEALAGQHGFVYPATPPSVGPENMRGIELTSYAAELARVSVWIGEIQWMLRHGFSAAEDPVLRPLDTIECRDALMSFDPDADEGAGRWVEAQWPQSNAIVGNPPFLGDKKMRGGLGDDYVAALRSIYSDRVRGGADFVMLWFAKALEQVREHRTERVGLVATQSIRRGASEAVLREITTTSRIFEAWSDEEWTVDGADVRVCLVCFGNAPHKEPTLNGLPVVTIHSDLSAGTALTGVPKLLSNSMAFIGSQKNGPFDIEGELARQWLLEPINPNGRPNSDVLRPWANGDDVTRRSSGKWIIDFGVDRSLEEASLYTSPFSYVAERVRPNRRGLRESRADALWWLHQRPRPALRKAVRDLARMIVTPRVSKYRVFTWLPTAVLPDSRLVAVARDDDVTFGILHSRFHEVWSLRLGGWHGVGNDPQYTPSLGFETFAFPDGLTPNLAPGDYATAPHATAIAEAAKRLDELRQNWLNPSDLVLRVPEVVAGYPDRILPRNDEAAAVLKSRTLTNLYNERPTWLDHAHKAVDAAVAAAYGWPADLADEEVLARLFALNQERAKASPQDEHE